MTEEIVTSGFSGGLTFARTSDTNAYTANDVIGSATGATAAILFSKFGPGSTEIMITSAKLQIDDTALISGESSYNLHLYSQTPPSALGDNAAFDVPSGDRDNYLGVISLGTPVDLGSTLRIDSDIINKQIHLRGESLWGYLVTVGGYTPTSARVYRVTLHGVRL